MILKYNNRVVTHNDRWIEEVDNRNYNPLNLAPYTVRARFEEGYTPYIPSGSSVTRRQISTSPNIWDLTHIVTDEETRWQPISYTDLRDKVLEIIGINSSNILNMNYTFRETLHVTSFPLFDTRSATTLSNLFKGCTNLLYSPDLNTCSCHGFSYMFDGCTNLKKVPLLYTNSETRITALCMFRNCSNVESGALEMYKQMSTQTPAALTYRRCFENCGVNTTTGLAELQQIPQSWGGLA